MVSQTFLVYNDRHSTFVEFRADILSNVQGLPFVCHAVIKMRLCVLEGKIIKVKCHFHHILSGVPDLSVPSLWELTLISLSCTNMFLIMSSHQLHIMGWFFIFCYALFLSFHSKTLATTKSMPLFSCTVLKTPMLGTMESRRRGDRG